MLRQCFDWFTTDRAWTGGKRMEPTKAQFVQGESTGPAERSIPAPHKV
jgi:hypothetical protein